jgi:hypothetical protein
VLLQSGSWMLYSRQISPQDAFRKEIAYIKDIWKLRQVFELIKQTFL